MTTYKELLGSVTPDDAAAAVQYGIQAMTDAVSGKRYVALTTDRSS